MQIPRPNGDLDYHRVRDQARLAEKVRGDVDIRKFVLERPREMGAGQQEERENAVGRPDGEVKNKVPDPPPAPPHGGVKPLQGLRGYVSWRHEAGRR